MLLSGWQAVLGYPKAWLAEEHQCAPQGSAHMQRANLSAWLVPTKLAGGRGKALKDLRFLQLIVQIGEQEMGAVSLLNLPHSKEGPCTAHPGDHISLCALLPLHHAADSRCQGKGSQHWENGCCCLLP